MSVSNYIIDKCKYRIDKLEKVVYMLNKESLGAFSENGYFIDGGAQATVIRCNSISVSETTSLDERYQFTHTLNFQVDGYMTETSFNERYYAVVKDMDGVYYLVNPEFKMKATYTYTLDSTSERTDFTLSTISNYPLMRIENFAPWASAGYTSGTTIYRWFDVTPTSDRNSYYCDFRQDNFVCSPYTKCTIDTIKLNERTSSVFCDDTLIYSNDGFKNVDFTKNSATLTETFDGTNITHTLKFTIPYNTSSWHNLLLDFQTNKYTALIKSTCGTYMICGIELGLLPSYSLAGSTTENDRIEISLDEMDDEGRLIYRTSEIPIIHS